jgi:uncharacterized 2Fe-2S/4Fe-4S cluster protein (DUF4445 family)
MKIRIIEDRKSRLIEIDEPENLLTLLQKQNVLISAPCGGKGTCGKCRVDIEGIGCVLSCQTIISREYLSEYGLSDTDDLTVTLPDHKKAVISTEGVMPDILCSPLLIRGLYLSDLPSLEDQRPDDQRFTDKTGSVLPFDQLTDLAGVMRTGRGPAHFMFRQDNKEVFCISESFCTDMLGIAVDIGTTTLAAYLYDLEEGKRLASTSMMNPQRTYGADVISRIEQIDNDAAKLEMLHKLIVNAVVKMSEDLLRSAEKSDCKIQTVVFSGNTVMMHLLAGLNPTAIARSPFLPVTLRGRVLKSKQLDLLLPGNPLCVLLPSISAYVGADITAGILACGMYEVFNADGGTNTKSDLPGAVQKTCRLLIDIGTNGEMVLLSNGRLLACSTAAGPAFEAANITCGTGGTEGAIDKAVFRNNRLECSVIGGNHQKIAGICGSGIVSVTALLLQTGVIDETGRFTDEKEKLPHDLAIRLSDNGGELRFYLDQPNGEIYINQKDIRELQNAKAAMAAGIQRLLDKAGLEPPDLDEVLIAGGFGNYLQVEDAFAIGLLPAELAGRTRSAGNTSGMGAIACLINDSYRLAAERAANSVQYLELSSDPEFTDLYIEAMMFPEK